MQSLQKVSKILLFELKIQRKNENQGVLKTVKKVLKQDIRKVGF